MKQKPPTNTPNMPTFNDPPQTPDRPKRHGFNMKPEAWTGELIKSPPQPKILVGGPAAALIAQKAPGLYPQPKTVPLSVPLAANEQAKLKP